MPYSPFWALKQRGCEMLTSKHFKTELKLITWANSKGGTEYIISIIKDVTNGDWVIFYIVE